MQKKNLKFDTVFDFETGVATATLTVKGKKYIGVARCHPDDDDRKSQYTGAFLAEKRAYIEYLVAERTQLRQEVKYLKQAHQIVSSTKDYDKATRYNSVLVNCINASEAKIRILNDGVLQVLLEIKTYLDGKEKVARLLAANRKAKETNK